MMLFDVYLFFFELFATHQDLPLLTHSFPTRRSSDLMPSVSGLRPEKRWPELKARNWPSHESAGFVNQNRTARSMSVDRPSAKPKPFTEPVANRRSEEHTSELQSLMRISYAVFCLKKKKPNIKSIQE